MFGHKRKNVPLETIVILPNLHSKYFQGCTIPALVLLDLVS